MLCCCSWLRSGEPASLDLLPQEKYLLVLARKRDQLLGVSKKLLNSGRNAGTEDMMIPTNCSTAAQVAGLVKPHV